MNRCNVIHSRSIRRMKLEALRILLKIGQERKRRCSRASDLSSLQNGLLQVNYAILPSSDIRGSYRASPLSLKHAHRRRLDDAEGFLVRTRATSASAAISDSRPDAGCSTQASGRACCVAMIIFGDEWMTTSPTRSRPQVRPSIVQLLRCYRSQPS